MAYSNYMNLPESYKEYVYSSIDNSSIEATFAILPEDVYPGTSDTGDPTTFAQGIDAMGGGMSNKFATLEEGRIKLDGTYIWPARDSAEVWGGWFEPTMDVTITMTPMEAVDMAGVTIIFDDKGMEYARHVTVELYGWTGGLMETIDITDNDSPVLAVQFSGAGMGEVVFTVHADSWVGTHYLKIASVAYGIVYHWGGERILRFEVEEQASMYASSLATPEARLTVDNSNGEFSIMTSNSVTDNLRQSLPISVAITIGTQRIVCCDWMLYDWSESAAEQSATFVCRPAVGFERRFTKVATGTELMYTIMSELGEETQLGWAPYQPEDEDARPIHEMVGNRYFGEDQQAADAVQQMANALASYWDVTREPNQIVLIKRDDLAPVREIYRSVQLEAPQITQAKEVKDIKVQYQTLEGTDYVAHTYTREVNSSGESVTVYAPQLYTEAQAISLAVNVETFLEQRATISLTMKGDPALRPMDQVFIEIEPGSLYQFTLTKVSTVFSEDVLTTTVEAIGGLQ